MAVQLAIASGSPIRDDLVIDTGLAHAASMSAAAAGRSACRHLRGSGRRLRISIRRR